MNKTEIPFDLVDGTSNCLTVFSPQEYASDTPVMVLFPAMGVAASYYPPFAEKLCAKGLIAITADIRGHGYSSERASAKNDYGYREIVEIDYPAVFEEVKKHFPKQPLYLVGHSLGGQMGCLYLSTSPNICQGLILIACCSVYYKGWSGISRPGTYVFTQLFGLIPRIIGYFPGKKIGFAGTEAKTQMIDWAYQARTGRYDPRNTDINYEALLSKLKLPVLAISLDGDTFAPEKAVKHLLGKFHPDSHITHLHLSKEDIGVTKASHFSWVKSPGDIPQRLLNWIGSI